MHQRRPARMRSCTLPDVLHRLRVQRTQVLGRSLHASSSVSAEALAEVALEGDGEGVLKEIGSIVDSESASPKEVADAAVALAYLQIKGNRRCTCSPDSATAGAAACAAALSLACTLRAAVALRALRLPGLPCTGPVLQLGRVTLVAPAGCAGSGARSCRRLAC